MDVRLSDLPVDPGNPPFIFFPEVVELDGLDEPVNIGLQARLLRAPEDIRIGLRQILDPFIKARSVGLNQINPWEFREISNGDGGTSFQYIDAPDERQFWIVHYWRKLFDRQLELADRKSTRLNSSH